MGVVPHSLNFLPDHQDLFTAHDSWTGYEEMLRILKRYNFGIHEVPGGAEIPGSKMSFSSYPGLLYSGDDFNILSPSGLVTLETTINCFSNNLWNYVHPDGQILEGIRATVANRLAGSGREWTQLFKKHNSGTYNNQWDGCGL